MTIQKNISKIRTIKIDGHNLRQQTIWEVSKNPPELCKVELTDESLKKITTAREYVFKIVESGKPVYGINTGFGALSNKFISKNELKTLQLNLIRSHCTGVGQPFEKDIVRAIMLLRANCLASGFSGVDPEIIIRLLDFLNFGITPIIPSKGSVGASGDLAPLSHLSLALIGEGLVEFQGNIMPSSKALEKIGKDPIILGPKDGLGLINGTAVMCALGTLAYTEAERLMKLADIAASLSIDGLTGSIKPFSEKISNLKPHPGQLETIFNVNLLLNDSEIINSHKSCLKVQDPYSLRCVPQVHGAARQTLRHAKEVLDIEINSVTDNPLIFTDSDEVISGGNFHGEQLAFCMDYLAIGLSEICNISERRVEKMMNPIFSDLPAFLAKNPGLNSGLMVAHVTAASLVSENKSLCFPASVDSIPTSTDKEDHVSMGPISGNKLHKIIENTKYCLAIEFLCNTQALEYRRPLKTGSALESVYSIIREKVPFIDEDRAFYNDIEEIYKLIDKGDILDVAEKISKELK